MTFEEAALLPRSEKITLVTCNAVKIAKQFIVYSGDTYYRDVDFLVSGVKESGTSFAQGSGKDSLNLSEFYFEPSEKRLYVRTSLSPVELNISIIFKLFFSNAPLILPNDLASGFDVEWLPYITLIGSVGQSLDEENTGIVLESQSTVKFINTDGYFDDIFDTLIFENQPIQFYSWFSNVPITEARKIFEGVIESKDFSTNDVTFKVKDLVYKLRNFVDLGLYSDSDGKIQDSLRDKPKRRIYGQVKQLQCAGVDMLLDGFTLTGTVTIAIGTNEMNGTGTSFLTQLSPGDELIFLVAGQPVKVGVESVTSDTVAVISKLIENSVLAQSPVVRPERSFWNTDRVWHVAGHKLREPLTTITSVISNNRFTLGSALDLFDGDRVLINDDTVTIRRISDSILVTENAVSPSPIITDVVRKIPIQKVFFGIKEMIYLRDWDYINTTESKITFNSSAEFNITDERLLGVSCTFTNSSRSVTTSAVVDFRSILRPRDYIRKNSIVSGENVWHEILEVKEQEIILRSAFTGTTGSTTALIKAVDYINDDSLVTVNCLGIESGGAWIKTPSDAVRHLILNDALFSSVNEDSFAKARADCEYILSLPIPLSLAGSRSSVRDEITKINESIFGSLYGDSSNSISFSVLNSNKPEVSSIIRDDDILSFDTVSNNKIANQVKVNYRPFTDTSNGEDATESASYNSGFVDELVGINRTIERTIYIYEADKAEIIAQRIALFGSLSTTTVNIKAKMIFALTSVNDKIFLSLDRLYKRFGGSDRRKIGTVTSVKKSEYGVDIAVTDLGNIYNRVPSIAPDATLDYLGSSADDKVQWGYIVDNDSLTPNALSEENLGCNIIG